MSEPTPHPADSPPPRSSTEPSPPDDFRWQALFQRSTDALFVLDRQRRLRFVNRAWEALTGLAAADVHLLSCRRQRAAGPGDSLLEVLARVLTPPPEVLQGEASRARRRLPGADQLGPRCWDVEFLPTRADGRTSSIVGRILPVVEATQLTAAILPERLLDLRERVVRGYNLTLLESVDPSVRRLTEQVRLAASLKVPVLLTGEMGTGKATLARVIHYRGSGQERSFVAIDCVRLPAEAIAEFLFGERGTIPGRPGAIYLREPGKLPRDLQARLHAWIGNESAPRVLVGCRVAPAEEVRGGQLLGELFAAFPLILEVPPLRERLADLPDLIQRGLERANEADGTRVTGLTPDAMEVLRGHPWPGNLRELQDVLASARRQATGPVLAITDLPAPLRLRHAAGPAPLAERPLPLDALLEQAERRLIELALRRARGHRGRAAEILGIWRARLIRRIDALGLGTPGPKEDEE
jgi:transcriptional regulator with PAS, ATPase and Fis domain